ncbi:MAG: hypothetical protein VX211_02230, partial [Pseudomonadota bacterium]|nr:hypothetical protein [Pseudomonadota bacterium]
ALRVHYDSSKFASVSFSDVLAIDLIGLDNYAAFDLDNDDGDADTDSYITVAWASLNGTWPGQIPTKLFDLDVQLTEGIADQTVKLRLSAIDTDARYALSATPVVGKVVQNTLDIDGNGEITALTDGLLVLRKMFGFDGSSLKNGAVGSDATFTEAPDIITRIDALGTLLDIDGDGRVDTLTDGLLILRYLFGFQGSTLIDGALGDAAIRTTAADIEKHMARLVPSS